MDQWHLPLQKQSQASSFLPPPPRFVKFSNFPKIHKGSLGTFHPVGTAGRSMVPGVILQPSECPNRVILVIIIIST